MARQAPRDRDDHWLPFPVGFEATGTLANEPLAPTALRISTGVPPLAPKLGEAKALLVAGTAKMSMWGNPLIIQAGIGTDF